MTQEPILRCAVCRTPCGKDKRHLNGTFCVRVCGCGKPAYYDMAYDWFFHLDGSDFRPCLRRWHRGEFQYGATGFELRAEFCNGFTLPWMFDQEAVLS